jgi:hypothetical protein
VNKISALNPPPLHVEIGADFLKGRRDNAGLELPLTRQPDGRLTTACKENVIAALGKYLKAKSWQPRIRALCAIGSRGVSFRRLTLPAGSEEEFHRRLLLQIEGEFPLSPEELAWGWQRIDGPQSSNGAMAKQELLVVAVKKEVIADYEEVLRACGTEPVFTLAALARKNLCASSGDSFALLDIGGSQSELTGFEKGVPTASRIIFWRSENASGPADARLNELAKAINGNLTGTKLFISGDKISGEFITRLGNILGNGRQYERLETAVGEGCSAAIAGLQKSADQNGRSLLMIRTTQTSVATTNWASLDLKKWGVRAGALVIALLLLPYAEAFLLKSHLEKKVAGFKAEQLRLMVIDRELDFLRYLKLSQPPYLDTLYIFAKSAPPGTRFDSLSLNSRGEVSLRTSFRDGQQVADFRSKLIASGFFTNVTVEEQVPSQQKVNVRISAQENAVAQLQSLAVGPSAEEIAKDEKPASPGAHPPANSVVPPILRKETK